MTKRPGRPPKYKGPIKRLSIVLPYDVAVEMEQAKGDLSWTDFLIRLYMEHKARCEGEV